MHADALPPPRDPGNEWGMPVVLALLVHVLVALVFIIAWVWSPSRSTEAAAGDPVVEASLQLSAAEAAAARSALRASEKLPPPPEPAPDAQPQPVPEDTVPPPQPIPEPRPQDAPTPQQHNAQERIAQPDTVDQERVSALAISQEKARQEQEAKRRQEQIDLTERKRVEEAEQKLRLARQQEEADRQKKLAEEQRKANEAKAEQERQQKIAEIRRKREQAERELKLAEQRQRQVADARARAQAAASSASPASGTPQASPGQGGTSTDLTAKYAAAIQQAVLNQWVRPDTIPRGQRCRLTIRQLPGGEVVDVQFAAGCPYDEAGRRSVEAAVLRAQPLPYRGFESVFQRTLNFTFEAQDR
ncbi:cell envelope integrity protein TolA [Stenotrophomonas acidaminiphila]|uniref:cell envelope integrity protein TolA n=1 Tax=Stenotrophomonas acidaminiphila TaxID=128780 RepID=UPI0028B0756C|nr:cell envelope integrity protein TolA [Stenotrophomonas acidaminiphila]